MKKGQINKLGKILLALALLIIIIIAVVLKLQSIVKGIKEMTDSNKPKELSTDCENEALALPEQIEGCFDSGSYDLAVEKAEKFLKENPDDKTIVAAKMHNFISWSYIEMDTAKYGEKIMKNAKKAKELSYDLNEEGTSEYIRALEAILEYSYREFKKLKPALKVNKPRGIFRSYWQSYKEMYRTQATPYDQKNLETQKDLDKSLNP